MACLPDVEKLRAHLALSLGSGAGTEAFEELRVLRRMSTPQVYDLRTYVARHGPFTHANDRSY